MLFKISKTGKHRGSFHRWIQFAFLIWAVVSTLWLANSMRTQGVDPALMQSASLVTVVDEGTTLAFFPGKQGGRVGLIFFCGSGVSAVAYAPLLRPIADAGYPVVVVKLPYRFAPLDAHKEEAIDRALKVIADHPGISRWVVSGHSLGGALAARMAKAHHGLIAGLVLVGTTHPKQDDLSFLQLPVTKIYAMNDGVAPVDKVLSNQDLLPKKTKWVEIVGGNHSQFGHYGHQLFDGDATISREAQQGVVRTELLDVLVGLRTGT
ncbi:MAG: alpha/beta fold hydrolase [Burkholderiales bacterium]|nr:alpha/beta fold hydrolase [Burkholderiales bacterium]